MKNISSNAVDSSALKVAVKPLSKFLACVSVSITCCLATYAFTVEKLVPSSQVPATYKWFLLKEIPGPRIIFESGSNSHHGIDTEVVGEALGMTAINIADNAGYPLEDKVTRLETFTRPGDVVILPLEWTHYHREKMTDNYVETLFTENRDYYRSMPLGKRMKRALSLPPEKVISEISKRKKRPDLQTESPAMELHVAALTHPTGHSSREVPSGPGLGVAEQTCDEYILGKEPVRKALKVGANIKPALERLKKLKARGVDIHFAWPILVGEGCMMADSYVAGFRADIEAAVNEAGFEFLGAASQSLYGQEFQDDTPYHLVKSGAAIHTQKIIGFLKAQGYGSSGTPFDIETFARHRLLELELADVKPLTQSVFPKNLPIAMEDESSREFVEFTAGWWAFEPFGRWMRDNRSMFRMTLPPNLAQDSVLKIQGRTLSGQLERVNVTIDGVLIHSGLFGEGTPLMVPVAKLPQGGVLSVFLTLPESGKPLSPLDRGENQDARSMTVHLQSFELIDQKTKEISVVAQVPLESVPAPIEPVKVEPVKVEPVEVQTVEEEFQSIPVKDVVAMSPFEDLSSLAGSFTTADLRIMNGMSNSVCGPVDFGTSHRLQGLNFGDGWWEQESAGRWMKGQEAQFKVLLPQRGPNLTNQKYELKLYGVFFRNREQQVRAVIDGKANGEIKRSADGTYVTVFETEANSEMVDVRLELSGGSALSPSSLGLSNDDRTLTYFLKAVELTET